MSYAIIGFGKIGHALAKAFARKGIEVSVATTRDPESFASAPEAPTGDLASHTCERGRWNCPPAPGPRCRGSHVTG
jgi:predicted dinucleotide-binding enzyme